MAVPVAATADGAVARLVAAPPLVEAVPILEPVVEPVAGLVTGVAPLPAILPGVPDVSDDLPEGSAPDPAALQTGSDLALLAVPEPAETAADEQTGLSGPALAHRGSAAAGTLDGSLPQAATDAPLTEVPLPSPVPAPVAPGSGTGSGASPSGPSGAAACPADFHPYLPSAGTCAISGAPEHAPSPVSFDPGSSPD
ncbi:MAG: hypothetical protein NVSMB43_08800 [Pseudarthrobacter sp.]